MSAKVITHSTPGGAKIDLTIEQAERLRTADAWPRTGNGSLFCHVHHGEHWGTPGYIETEIEMIIEDGGDVTRADRAKFRRLYPPAKVITYSAIGSARINLALKQVERLRTADAWPRIRPGNSYCDVYRGEHWGTPDYTDAEIGMIIEDEGDVTRADSAKFGREYQPEAKQKWTEIVDAALVGRQFPNTAVYRNDLAYVRDMTEEQIWAVERFTRTPRSADQQFVAACKNLRAHDRLPRAPGDTRPRLPRQAQLPDTPPEGWRPDRN